MAAPAPSDETFLEFARRTCGNQGTRSIGSLRFRDRDMVPHALPDYLGGPYSRRPDPPTASWPELRAYLAAEGAPPNVVEAARSAWRTWERRHARAAQLELDL